MTEEQEHSLIHTRQKMVASDNLAASLLESQMKLSDMYLSERRQRQALEVDFLRQNPGRWSLEATREAQEAIDAKAVLDFLLQFPTIQLSASLDTSYPDNERWWCWIPAAFGGDDTVFKASTPMAALKAVRQKLVQDQQAI